MKVKSNSLLLLLSRLFLEVAGGATRRSIIIRSLSLLSLLLLQEPQLAAGDVELAGTDFFESKIRPIFVESCYKCHSAQSEKVKGGLLLDTKEALLKGGDTGPAIVPGDPEKSLLIKAIRYGDENLQMPPKNKKLSPEQIALLEHWVKIGAPDPRVANAAPTNKAGLDKRASHWAFQPIRQPSLPLVKNKQAIQTPIDAFIFAKLEEKQLQPSKIADKRSLIRRAAFDLIGLPPTSQETARFLADESPEAFERVIDRLLDSPRYGERWARHWLDVARYSDTKGYVFEEERRYPYSYTYRDYVIRAFNEDLPFNEFIIQQIAADLLPLGDDKRPLAALGFLTLGRRFLNSQPDIIDDRIDVVTRGMMGLTVACARCHDHKYDPIPTKDYYSLYGVFASCSEPNEKPLLGMTPSPSAYADYLAERKKRDDEWTQFRDSKELEALAQLRERAGEYMLAAYDSQRLSEKSKSEGLARERKLDPSVVQHWISSLEKWAPQSNAIFTPWFAFAALPQTNFATLAPDVMAKLDGQKINPLIAEVLRTNVPTSMKDVAAGYSKVFKTVDARWNELAKKSPASPPERLADSHEEALRQIIYGEESPAFVAKSDLNRLFDVPTAQKVRALKRKLDELDATHPGAPPRAMALQDNSTPTNPKVFLRGNPSNPGAEVPRQFVEVIAGPNRKPFTKGSGRLELAEAIASPDNPLTARVIVNRIWLQHFGSGLVRTPSDFGLRSDPPANPELLDYLASRFVSDGWSLKRLHKQIMLSRVYQQTSDENPVNETIDPGNQLLWRMNRQRLDFESMRDTLLAVSGKIDLTAGGRGDDLTKDNSSLRRTVYGFIERQNLPGMFRTFDFASPDATSPQRFSTTVPQQALFMVNSPFVVEKARELAARPEVASASSNEEKIQRLYEITVQRLPDLDELNLGLRFIQQQGTNRIASTTVPIWQNGYGAYDPKERKIKKFHLLPHFTGDAWQGGGMLPDSKLGWVLLDARGGHPGDLSHAAIRRWTAPETGFYSVTGLLGHDAPEGDGVRARLISSRHGELCQWVVHHGKLETELSHVEAEKGDTLDFVVDCNKTVTSDSFSWATVIKRLEPLSAGGATPEWDAASDFSGPKQELKPLTAWEKYAQVLLMSNELVFVD